MQSNDKRIFGRKYSRLVKAAFTTLRCANTTSRINFTICFCYDYWDFRDALRRKFLCFFCAKLRIRQQEAENVITLKQLKVKTSNLKLRWGTYESFFVQNLGAINLVIRISEPKTEMPFVGLNSFSLKADRTSGIKVSNLERSGQAFQLPKINYDDSDTFLLIGTFATLRVESPCDFSRINYEFSNRGKKTLEL